MSVNETKIRCDRLYSENGGGGGEGVTFFKGSTKSDVGSDLFWHKNAFMYH